MLKAQYCMAMKLPNGDAWHHRQDNGDWGWRVVIMESYVGYPDHQIVLPMKFARPVDARLAKMALERAGLTTVADMQRAGEEQVYRIMCEALQW